MRAGLDHEVENVHASAADLVHKARILAQAPIYAVRDLTIDCGDRARVKSEIADVASALATPAVALNEPSQVSGWAERREAICIPRNRIKFPDQKFAYSLLKPPFEGLAFG